MLKFSGILIAGGKSARFGSDKKEFIFKNKSLLEISLNKLKELSDDVKVVLSNPDKSENMAANTITDLLRDKGPLAGIYTGLKAAANEKVFVLPVDMPFVSTGLMKWMSKFSYDYELVIPFSNERFHPLSGIYSKSLIADIDEWLACEKKPALHKFIGSLEQDRIKIITEKEIKNFGDPGKLLLNINTEEDLKKAHSYEDYK